MRPKYSPLWMGLDAVFDFGNVQGFKKLWAEGYLTDQRPRISVFISHEWTNGDVDAHMWVRLRQAFEAIAESPDLGAFWFVEEDPPRFGQLIRWIHGWLGVELLESGAEDIANTIRNDTNLATYIASRLNAMREFSRSKQKDKELIKQRVAYQLRGLLGIWIDHCCLDQEEPIQQLLSSLTVLANESIVIALWPEEEFSESAWCMAELALNRTSGKLRALRVDKQGSLEDLSQTVITACEDLLATARKARSSADVKQWFVGRQLKCEDPNDLNLLATAIYAAVRPSHDIGWRYLLVAGFHFVLETIWWLACGVSGVIFNTLGAACLAVGNEIRRRNQPTCVDGTAGRLSPKISPAWMKTKTLAFLCIGLDCLAFLWTFTAFFWRVPGWVIEPFRRAVHASMVRERATFIAKTVSELYKDVESPEPTQVRNSPPEPKLSHGGINGWPLWHQLTAGIAAAVWLSSFVFRSWDARVSFLVMVSLINYTLLSFGVFDSGRRSGKDWYLACLKLVLAFVILSAVSHLVAIVVVAFLFAVGASPDAISAAFSSGSPDSLQPTELTHSVAWLIIVLALLITPMLCGFMIALGTATFLAPGMAGGAFVARITGYPCNNIQLTAVIYSLVLWALLLWPEVLEVPLRFFFARVV